MSKMFRLFPMLILFFAVGLIVSLLNSFFVTPAPELLSIFTTDFKFSRGILSFINIYSAIQICTFLFYLAYLFGKLDSENEDERAVAMQKYLQGVFVICIITVGTYIVLTEATKPLLEAKMQKQKTLTTLYFESKRDAQNLLKSSKISELNQSEYHIKQALAIYPTSAEAKNILDAIQLKKEQLALKPVEEQEEEPEKLINAEMLLVQAKQSLKDKDFFSAHYQATQAEALAVTNQELKAEANKIVIAAWTLIQEGDVSVEKEQQEIYNMKRVAYNEFINDNLLVAYDRFFDVKMYLKEQNSSKKDPQIEYFLRIIREKLYTNVFFVDELNQIPAFVNGSNLEFTIFQNHKKRFHIFAEGIALGSSKKTEAYLKNAVITKYNYLGVMEWKIRLPYAKIIPNTDEHDKEEIILQMTGINKNRKEEDILPEVVFGIVSGKDSLNQTLPVSFADFLLVNSANYGINTLDLVSLYKLSKKADNLGFSKENILFEFVTRQSEFLLLFILSIIACTTAWKYRMNTDHRFKVRWVFSLPLFYLISQLLVDIYGILAKLASMLFVKFIGIYAVPVITLIWIALLIFTSLRFLKNYKN